MNVERLPAATARRLPLYYRHLQTLHALGRLRVSSAEVGDALHIDSATVRRDFSRLGELGRKGYGYSVSYLVEILEGVLGQDEIVHVALIGVGNLGTALCRYNFFGDRRMSIVGAFDVDPLKVGLRVDSVPVHPMRDLGPFVKDRGIEVAILTVPAGAAQEAADAAVEAGIRGILSFAPRALTVPSHVRVHHIDVTTELQILIYYVRTGGRAHAGEVAGIRREETEEDGIG